MPEMPATSPIYIYAQTVNQVLRLLSNSNDEPFHGLSGRFLFLGYVGHTHQLSSIYWPEEHIALARPPHDILRHVGYLLVTNDTTRYSIYEIEVAGSAFLKDCKTNVCAPNLHGGISPIWLLDQLVDVQFTPAIYPHGFPPPSLPIPIDAPAWQTPLPQPLACQEGFLQPPFGQSLDFDYEPTLFELTSIFDFVPAPTLPDDDDQEMCFVSTQTSGETQPPHPDLPWRHTSRGDILDKSQKLLLKSLLAASPWGRSIKLAKYLFVGNFLVGMQDNPFIVPEAISRQLITTSFLRALRFNQQPYEELSEKPLTIVDDDGQETVVRWSYLRNRFMDFYIDITSEIRKITRGSTSPLAEFVTHEDKKLEKILNLIVALNSGDQKLVQQAICNLIKTQAFKEVLWAALLRPIAELAEGNARLADLYPDAIQTWMGYLRKGIVGVLITLMYQAFNLQIPSDSMNLKAAELHPKIMAALDDMYSHPDRFTPFFRVARELPSLQESNILVMDPKHKVPKFITDKAGVRRMKTMNDLKPIDVVATSDFEVPHAKFVFPVVSSSVEMDLKYFTKA
ncbi:hypothetical protein BDR05DRAFT_1003418 [Suillus weaverae]|nr:hypothetical protein BDR05DRAFT_1003418 [Suillus weaverae]